MFRDVVVCFSHMMVGVIQRVSRVVCFMRFQQHNAIGRFKKGFTATLCAISNWIWNVSLGQTFLQWIVHFYSIF